jgi:hypothetical protein
MPRTKGISEFPANFEIQYSAPIDARMVVSTLADLANSTTWQSYDAQAYTYIGMLVSVIADPDTNNNGVYLLQGNDYTKIANWKKIDSENTTILNVYNEGKNTIPKGTLVCQDTAGMHDTYISIRPMQYPTDIPIGIILNDIIANSTGAILVSGIWDVGNISGLDISRVQINDTVYIDLENYQVTTLKQYIGCEIGRITRISPLGVYFDFGGLINEERFHKIELTETYYASNCIFSEFSNTQAHHLNTVLGNIFYEYNKYAPILFWDIEQNGKKYNALHFYSIDANGDFQTFMKTFQSGYPVYISIYILQEKNISYIPMTSAVNTYFSRLRTRSSYTSKTIKNMKDSLSSKNPLDFNFAKNTAQAIITNFNITGLDLNNTNNYSIFHFVNTGIKNYYTMYPTKVTGIEVYNSNGNTKRTVYDATSHTVVMLSSLSNIQMVIKESKLFNTDIKHRDITVTYLDENIFNDHFNMSIIRVYHLVDNLVNPRYHSFFIKPYGVDNIILDYKKDIRYKILENSNYPIIALLTNKTKKRYTLTVINYALTIDENHKALARFDIEDIITSSKELKKLLSIKNSNKRTEGRIKFYCKYVNGVLTPPLCEVDFVTKRAGLSHVLLPI